MKNFFENIISMIIAFILISLGLYAMVIKDKKLAKELKENIDILLKKSSEKKEP